MHDLIAAGGTSNLQYATESWSKGGVVLGLVVLFIIVGALVGVARAS